MRTLRLWLLPALALAACDKADTHGEAETVPGTRIVEVAPEPPPPPPPIDTPPVTIAVPDPVVLDAGPGPTPNRDAANGLELVSNGAEPRFTLRYQGTKGTREAMSVSMAMQMTVPPNPTLVFPRMLLGADAEILSVDGSGAMQVELTMTSADVEETAGAMVPAAEVRAQMGEVIGMKTSMNVDSHGWMTDVKGRAIIQTMQQSQMGFDQLVAPLPTEPVGKGARWRVRSTVDQNGLALKQVVTFELLAVTATTAHLRTKGSLTAPRQEIDWQGMKVDLESTTGKAVNDLVIDFTRIVPTVSGTVEMTMHMNAQGEHAEMSTKSVMEMRAK